MRVTLSNIYIYICILHSKTSLIVKGASVRVSNQLLELSGLYLAPGTNDFIHWRIYHSYFAPAQSQSKVSGALRIHSDAILSTHAWP